MFRSIENPLSEGEKALRQAFDTTYSLLKGGDLLPGDEVCLKKIEVGLNEIIPRLAEYREMLTKQ